MNNDMDLLYEIAKNITFLREHYDFTQEVVANKLNISRSTYVNWETAISFPPLIMLDKISVLYNTSFDYLLGKSKSPKINYKTKPIHKDVLLNNLINYRKKYNYTLSYIAKCCNTSISNCYYIEKGFYNMRIPYLYKLLKIYDVSADIFLGKK